MRISESPVWNPLAGNRCINAFGDRSFSQLSCGAIVMTICTFCCQTVRLKSEHFVVSAGLLHDHL